MKTLLVTGGAGHIGTNVCLEGVSRGWKVICFDNFVRPRTEENIKYLKEAGVKIVRGDIRNKIDFDKLGEKIDGIVHLAGQCGIPYSLISPYYDFEVNVAGTLNVLEYSRNNGKIPVAFAASNKCYTNITNTIPTVENGDRLQLDASYRYGNEMPGLDFDKGFSENLPLDASGKYARSPYGTSKVSADLYCQEYYQAFGVPTVVNRMSCIYGYYQKGVEEQAWISWFIHQIDEGDGKINIFGTGKQVRDMLWGGDVAKLYLDEIENIDKVKGEVFNVGGGKENTMSLLECIKYIEEVTGKKSELVFEGKRLGDQDVWISDITKVTTALPMWKPQISPKEGISLMVEKKI